MIDQSSFLIAIGFAATALALTALVIWMGSRTYTFLLFWGTGLAIGVPSVVLLGVFMDPYSPLMNFVAFVFLLSGLVVVMAGSSHFRLGRINMHRSIIAWLLSVGLTGFGFAIGLSGVGVIFLNLSAGALLIVTGIEFWLGRKEAPLAATAISILYALLAVSFFLCVIPLVESGTYVLEGRPDNWAEDLNSIMIIIAVAGVGALMLMLAQGRATQMQQQLAMIDPLSGLLNRRALFELAQQHGLRPGATAIMFDLDRFKQINDRFGHFKGDEVIVQFARILAENTRAEDWAVRLGGEEFCVIMRTPSSNNAFDIAERIRVVLASSDPLSVEYGPPTVSAGIAVLGQNAAMLDDLLRDADEALYKAKTAGRNRVQATSPCLAVA